MSEAGEKVRIVGISGSLRRVSFSTALPKATERRSARSRHHHPTADYSLSQSFERLEHEQEPGLVRVDLI